MSTITEIPRRGKIGQSTYKYPLSWGHQNYRIEMFQPCPWCGCSTNVDDYGFLFCENIHLCGARWTLRGIPIERGKGLKDYA